MSPENPNDCWAPAGSVTFFTVIVARLVFV